MTALDETKKNVTDGMKIAGSMAALNKLIDILDVQLRQAGVDTAFLQTPVGKSLAQLALPTLLLSMCDLQQLRSALGDSTVEALRDVAGSAQVGASISGTTTLINVFSPVLAEFAKVKGSLPEGSHQSVEDLLGDLSATKNQ